MRIGILTLTDNTNGYNYGATFQCLALQRTLERLNNEVLVFNFKSVIMEIFVIKQLII